MYQIIGSGENKGGTVYLAGFNSEGSYMWKSKFDFQLFPAIFLPLPSGDFLISSHEYDAKHKAKRVLTGIFSPDATLKRKLNLPGDKDLEDQSSKEKAFGVIGYARLAEDGNVYILRPAATPEVVVLDQAGNSLRSVKVKAPVENSRPVGLYTANNRLLVVFQVEEARKPGAGPRARMLYRLFDRETGEPLITYVPPERAGILACVVGNEVTYLKATDDGHFGIARAALP